MAFPVVETTAVSSTDTAGTNHVVTLPSGIQAGDLILIVMSIGSTPATLNAHADYSEVLDENLAVGLKVLYRWAAGGETNPTFVSSASTRDATITFRISGAANPATQAPQVGTTSTGSSVNPDPPTTTPTGGAKDYLWITFCGSAGEQADDGTYCTAFPTNYNSNQLEKTCGIAGTNLGGMIAAATRTANAASENPGTFTVSENNTWRAQTVAVHPGPLVATKTGSGVLDRSGALHWVGTRVKKAIAVLGGWAKGNTVDPAVLVPVASGADAVMFADTGTGITVRTAGGTSQKTSGEIAKTGAGVRDHIGAATDAVSSAETGTGIQPRAGAAADTALFAELGAGVLARVGSGASEKAGAAIVKTGVGVRGHVGSAADAVITDDSGAGIRGQVGSGDQTLVYSKTGPGVRGHTAQAADAVTAVDSGVGILDRTASGVSAGGSGVFDTLYKGAWGDGLVVDAMSRQVIRTTGNRVYFFAPDDTGIQGSAAVPIRAMKGNTVPIPSSFVEVDNGDTQQPTIATGGTLSTPDCRYEKATGIVHMVYETWTSGGVHELRYAQFDTGADEWTVNEQVVASGVAYIDHAWKRSFLSASLSLDTDGGVHVVYGTRAGSVIHTKRTGVATWTLQATITSTGQTSPTHFNSTIGKDGVHHVVWVSDPENVSVCAVRYAQRTGPTTWSSVETIDSTAFRCNEFDTTPTVVIINMPGTTNDQRPVAGWLDQTTANIKVARRDAAATWTDISPSVDTHAPGMYAQGDDLYVFEGHQIPAAGNVYPAYIRSLDGGGTWSSETVFVTGDGQDADGAASVRYDPLNETGPGYIDWVAWDEDTNAGGVDHQGKAYYICVRPAAVNLLESGVLGRVGSGSSAKVTGGGAVTSKAGAGVRDHVGAAVDAVVFTDAGAGVIPYVAAGADAVQSAETGAGVRGHVGSGASSRAGGADKTGAGIRGQVGSGPDVTSSAETGSGVRGQVGAGADALTQPETGTGIRGQVGSGAGARGAENVKTGSGVRAHTASGFDQVSYTEPGTAITVRVGLGADAGLYIERGTGILDHVGAGAKFKLGEHIKFGSGVMAHVGSGASLETLQLPPSGTLTSVHTGRLNGVRAGRITKPKEGVLT